MVVKEEDILVVKTKDEWITPGVEYAEKSWSSTFNRMGKADIYYRMRKIVTGITVQRCFEHQLKDRNIKYKTKEREKWYETDRYDILVDSRKYDIKSNFLDASDIGSVLSPTNIKWLFDCSALVPTDQLYSRTLKEDDLYIFAFMMGKIHKLYGYNPKAVLSRLLGDKDGKRIIHGFWDYEFLKPPKWTKEHGFKDLGHIMIKSTSVKDSGKGFIIGGTRAQKEFQFEEITLERKLTYAEAVTTKEFFQLFFLRPLDNNIPDGKLTIECEKSRIQEIIEPRGGFETLREKKKKGKRELKLLQNDWDDIWLYDSHIYIVGYMSKGEFKEKSEELKRFDKTVKQFEIKADNNRLYVPQLRPIKGILY